MILNDWNVREKNICLRIFIMLRRRYSQMLTGLLHFVFTSSRETNQRIWHARFNWEEKEHEQKGTVGEKVIRGLTLSSVTVQAVYSEFTARQSRKRKGWWRCREFLLYFNLITISCCKLFQSKPFKCTTTVGTWFSTTFYWGNIIRVLWFLLENKPAYTNASYFSFI